MQQDPKSEGHAVLELMGDDQILPFHADRAGVIGRMVRLGPVVDTVLSRHEHPEPVSQLLGEAVALTAMLGASLKFDGKFIMQTSTDGVVDLMVVDYQTPGRLRGYARYSPVKLEALESKGGAGALLGKGHLAMTIDGGSERERYQGIVPLDGEGLSQAAHTYFRQSEQLPTYVRLAVAKHYDGKKRDGPRAWTWRAGGLMIQKLTREGGDTPVGPGEDGAADEDWTRARLLAATVEDHELLDPTLEPDRLLYRLFHEEEVRAFRPQSLGTYCSCSRDRVEGLLARFSEDDLADMVVDEAVTVTCEFCNRKYRFELDELPKRAATESGEADAES